MHVEYMIIGAGPTGLGAAYRLKELGCEDFLILEAGPKPGGLASSFQDEMGFVWDIGVHVQFSHYSYFDHLMTKVLGPDGWLTHKRDCGVWVRDRYVPYPFQNNIRCLSRDDLWKCLAGIVRLGRQGSASQVRNFREWIVATFGEGIADLFMIPYNYKVWGVPAEQMAYQWVGERVSVIDLEGVLHRVLFEENDVEWGPNSMFRFPKRGGAGAAWRGLAQLIGHDSIRLNAEVTEVRTRERAVVVSTGEKIEYEHLLSTMPIDALTERIPDIPDCCRVKTGELKRCASHIVGVGLKGSPRDQWKGTSWIYFPEHNCPFYRVAMMSNYSPYNVPDNDRFWSLLTETSETSHKPVDRATLVEDAIAGLLNTKMISSRGEIVSTWAYTAEYGYPTPCLKRDAILAETQPWLESQGVYSRGRFGGWKYEVANQDHSLMQGVEWAQRILFDVPETTYRFPGTANSNWGRIAPARAADLPIAARKAA